MRCGVGPRLQPTQTNKQDGAKKGSKNNDLKNDSKDIAEKQEETNGLKELYYI